MAQLERRLQDVEDSPDGHAKLTPDHQLGVANGLEPPKEQDRLTTTAPSAATYALKNHENDVTNRLKQETNRLKQQVFEVQDAGYEEEDYIVVDDEESGLRYYNTEIVQDEVLKAFLGLDTFGTREIFKKEHKETQVPEPTRTDWTAAASSSLSPQDYGAECASGNGFFDSIHALSVAAQNLEGETSLESTSVQVGPAKNIEKQEKRSSATGLVNSYPGSGPRADNANSETALHGSSAISANSETALHGSSAISDKPMEKDDENVRLRDNEQKPDHAQQKKSSDTGQGQEEDFRAQPASDVEYFSSPIPEKGIVRTTPKEQTIKSPLQDKGSADTGLVYSHPSTEPNDLITTMEPRRNDEHKANNPNSGTALSDSSPVTEKEIVHTTLEVEQTIETKIEEDPEFATIREAFYDAEAPDIMQRSDVGQEDQSHTTMEPPRNEEHKANNANSETASPDLSLVHEKEIVQTTPEVEQTIETLIEEDPEFATIRESFYHVEAPDNMQRSDVVGQEDESHTTMEPPRNDEHKANNANIETASPDSSPVPEKEIVHTTPEVEQTIETPIEEDREFATIRESFYYVEAPDNMQRSDVGQEDESHGQDESGRSDSGKVRLVPRPDNALMSEEAMMPAEEKPNTVEGRRDGDAEIASRKQEEFEAGETEEQKSYDHQKSYTEKIYETASGAAHAVASKLGYGAAEGQSDETDSVKEGTDKGRKGIVERAGGAVASFLGIKHQEEDGHQSPHDMQEQEQTEEENEETVEPQFWDAEAEAEADNVDAEADNVDTV